MENDLVNMLEKWQDAQSKFEGANAEVGKMKLTNKLAGGLGSLLKKKETVITKKNQMKNAMADKLKGLAKNANEVAEKKASIKNSLMEKL